MSESDPHYEVFNSGDVDRPDTHCVYCQSPGISCAGIRRACSACGGRYSVRDYPPR